MISTVTTSTVTTVTTAALAGSVALIGVLILFSLLVQKEVASSSENQRMSNLSKYLLIGIIPLLIAFVLLVISKVSEFL